MMIGPQHLRPLVRLLRKKIVLALIFSLSLTYCVVSLLRDDRVSDGLILITRI